MFELPSNLGANKPAVEASVIKITPSVVANLEVAPLDLSPQWKGGINAPYDYKIGVGDVLSIVVWDHPELTAPFGSFNNVQDQGNVVREDGTIFYPFVGQLEVAGRTARAIQEELAVKLADYIESPQLDVRVVNYRSQRFFVTGFVSNPGTYPVTDVPVRVVEALGIAGGLLPMLTYTMSPSLEVTRASTSHFTTCCTRVTLPAMHYCNTAMFFTLPPMSYDVYL